MAIVTYRVPEPVKAAFDRTFAGENKSAVIARLMRDAVAERHRQTRRTRAVDALLAIRRRMPPVTPARVRVARGRGRP